ncbi:hypothetical protein E2C01_009914 [Portunus trituberculatus]|uniref:Uncharacterized protein n=1 Tax=Portunus trituberculatus TaxID=210409 RepID=A0A5B7D713_PORTR|nr:hypothetical protein [Portunus trituberculatus]
MPTTGYTYKASSTSRSNPQRPTYLSILEKVRKGQETTTSNQPHLDIFFAKSRRFMCRPSRNDRVQDSQRHHHHCRYPGLSHTTGEASCPAGLATR